MFGCRILEIHRGIPRQYRVTIAKVMEFRSAVLGSHFENHWKYGKIDHEKGLKFGPSLKINV